MRVVRSSNAAPPATGGLGPVSGQNSPASQVRPMQAGSISVFCIPRGPGRAGAGEWAAGCRPPESRVGAGQGPFEVVAVCSFGQVTKVALGLAPSTRFWCYAVSPLCVAPALCSALLQVPATVLELPRSSLAQPRLSIRVWMVPVVETRTAALARPVDSRRAGSHCRQRPRFLAVAQQGNFFQMHVRKGPPLLMCTCDSTASSEEAGARSPRESSGSCPQADGCTSKTSGTLLDGSPGTQPSAEARPTPPGVSQQGHGTGASPQQAASVAHGAQGCSGPVVTQPDHGCCKRPKRGRGVPWAVAGVFDVGTGLKTTK
ncbi:hypothetical protein ACCO45_012092 [Purpureocillium lilacinum]|uniref:Uncharacterized protein n=1 Tax=Purpureocillium lilacinum TaxID=33203 RepID=A0ACC4DCQ9_PURLI